jgi:hypothetical protein
MPIAACVSAWWGRLQRAPGFSQTLEFGHLGTSAGGAGFQACSRLSAGRRWALAQLFGST